MRNELRIGKAELWTNEWFEDFTQEEHQLKRKSWMRAKEGEELRRMN